MNDTGFTIILLLFVVAIPIVGVVAEGLGMRRAKKYYQNKEKKTMKFQTMNAFVLNGKVTELTEDQVKSIIEGLAVKVNKGDRKLSDIKVGDTFNIGKREFIVLEQSGETTAVLSKDLIKDEVAFGDTPDFANSEVRKVLAEFGAELATEIGADAFVEHTVDQTTLDGMKLYGSTKALMSLMTIDHVRKYADVLDEHKVDKWYWLVTPWSTPDRGWERSMCVVAPSGCVSVNYGLCFLFLGVRPFCILKSDIFVS